MCQKHYSALWRYSRLCTRGSEFNRECRKTPLTDREASPFLFPPLPETPHSFSLPSPASLFLFFPPVLMSLIYFLLWVRQGKEAGEVLQLGGGGNTQIYNLLDSKQADQIPVLLLQSVATVQVFCGAKGNTSCVSPPHDMVWWTTKLLQKPVRCSRNALTTHSTFLVTSSGRVYKVGASWLSQMSNAGRLQKDFDSYFKEGQIDSHGSSSIKSCEETFSFPAQMVIQCYLYCCRMFIPTDTDTQSVWNCQSSGSWKVLKAKSISK